MSLPMQAIVSIVTMLFMYALLISEKVNKVVVTLGCSAFLIIAQIFANKEGTSQHNAFEFISHNLDVLLFIIGMMILTGIVSKSGFFDAISIQIVKFVKGNPKKLLVALGYLAYIMTVFISNIPTVLVLAPIIIVLVKQLKLPFLPYFFTVVTMANIAGAVTPLSDPTTYYQSKTAGLSFVEVFTHSGFISMLLSLVVIAYSLFIFRKELEQVDVNPTEIALFKPSEAIKDQRILKLGVPLLFITILVMATKDVIGNATGIVLENGIIALTAALIAIITFGYDTKKALHELVDWEVIFFFMGLFIVIGSLEFTGVTKMAANGLVALVNGNLPFLLFFITLGSSVLSVFIDNVPYNIAMVSTILSIKDTGIFVEPLWWGLNLGTSIGGAGSLIGATCNVVAFGIAEHDGYHTNFLKYLLYGLPLVIINGLITFCYIYLQYFVFKIY